MKQIIGILHKLVSCGCAEMRRRFRRGSRDMSHLIPSYMHFHICLTQRMDNEEYLAKILNSARGSVDKTLLVRFTRVQPNLASIEMVAVHSELGRGYLDIMCNKYTAPVRERINKQITEKVIKFEIACCKTADGTLMETLSTSIGRDRKENPVGLNEMYHHIANQGQWL